MGVAKTEPLHNNTRNVRKWENVNETKTLKFHYYVVKGNNRKRRIWLCWNFVCDCYNKGSDENGLNISICGDLDQRLRIFVHDAVL